MKRAVELAKQAWGMTHPNPMVGAVIVKSGRIIGEGFHEKDGGLHAERNALNSLKESAAGAEMYVSLEPCSTKGRTGACTDAIIKSGIKKVFIGSLDPNPAHAGRAIKVLNEAGIECECGILRDECEDLNIIFNTQIVSQKAMLAIKFAKTKNGKIAEHAGRQSQITSTAAREHLMRWRALFPAIAVGFGTLLSDNPALTIRDKSGERSSRRFLFDRSLNCADLDLSKFKLFSDKFKDMTTVVCDADSPKEKIEFLKNRGVNVLQIPAKRADEGKFWDEFKTALNAQKISGVMVEGGAKILTSIIKSCAADYVFEYTAGKVFDAADALDAFACPAPEIKNPILESLPPDECRRGFLQK